MIVASGVRNSWLALATKSVRIRSAAWTAERSVSRTSAAPSASGRRADVPRALGRADPDEVDSASRPRQDRVERQRVADGEAQVAADDRLAEQRAGGAIGGDRALALDDQRGLRRSRRGWRWRARKYRPWRDA